MKLSKHAAIRKRQRGFSKFTLDIILQFGRYKNAPGGATKVYFGKKEHQKTVQELKQVIQLLDRAKNGSMIISEDKVITVYK